MELEINEKIYEFTFGMAFLRDINKKIETPIEVGSAIKQQIGLKYYLSLLLDGDLTALVDVLEIANRTSIPRLSAKEIDKFIDSEADTEQLFTQVLEGLGTANATKKILNQVQEAVVKARIKAKA
jgi:hypothetical protein